MTKYENIGGINHEWESGGFCYFWWDMHSWSSIVDHQNQENIYVWYEVLYDSDIILLRNSWQ